MDSVGGMIRHWRKQRRMSQLHLAEAAEVSTRHVSCLETGRAQPSRQMVLVLASALDVPLRHRNTLLQAAGFAPAYRETDLEAPGLEAVRYALGFMLEAASVDEVGMAFDRALRAGVRIQQTLGRHPNDRMFSFYAETPSGFQFEFGWGGRLVDDRDWSPGQYDHISEWGHHHPSVFWPRKKK